MKRLALLAAFVVAFASVNAFAATKHHVKHKHHHHAHKHAVKK